MRLLRGRELTFDKLFYDEHEYNHFRERDECVLEKRKLVFSLVSAQAD